MLSHTCEPWAGGLAPFPSPSEYPWKVPVHSKNLSMGQCLISIEAINREVEQ
jgi:hypothetical protein